MNFYEFLVAMGTDSLFILVILGISLFVVIHKAIVRICRSVNISKRGWPPPHCDADGDFKDEED
jgi:hypothetical protein